MTIFFHRNHRMHIWVELFFFFFFPAGWSYSNEMMTSQTWQPMRRHVPSPLEQKWLVLLIMQRSGLVCVSGLYLCVWDWCTIAVATRGRSLSEELRAKLLWEWKRGNRAFLTTGRRSSSASVCNTRAQHSHNNSTSTTPLHCVSD